MQRHPDLMTRREAAQYLCVSPSKLAHGWGLRPLPPYARPVMYSRKACDAFLENDQGNQRKCENLARHEISTNDPVQPSGGVASGTKARKSGAQREQLIAARLKSKLDACESHSRLRLPNALRGP